MNKDKADKNFKYLLILIGGIVILAILGTLITS